MRHGFDLWNLEMNQEPERPVVFAEFRGKEILREMGRLLFSLVDVFVSAGYRILLFDNLPASELGKYGPLAFALPHLSVTNTLPADTRQMIYLFDERDPAAGRRVWRKEIQVRYDVFSPYWFSDPIVMPYPVHPAHSGAGLAERLKECRQSQRRMRIFFSGDTEGYVRNRIRYPNEKLPRLVVVNTIREQLGERLSVVQDEAGLASELAGTEYRNRFLMADPGSFRIDSAKWLNTLAMADFFLCPPGYVMPMCHNTVEAMAVGAIPIINYPEWFQPRLAHLENCIVFGDGSDLIRQLHAVLTMSSNQIAEMRRRVIDYYEHYLTPESFTRRIETSKERKAVVLMITDANVVRKASRLNGHSVLLRGARPSGSKGLASMLRRLKTGAVRGR